MSRQAPSTPDVSQEGGKGDMTDAQIADMIDELDDKIAKGSYTLTATMEIIGIVRKHMAGALPHAGEGGTN
jgi:hypothetical protein